MCMCCRLRERWKNLLFNPHYVCLYCFSAIFINEMQCRGLATLMLAILWVSSEISEPLCSSKRVWSDKEKNCFAQSVPRRCDFSTIPEYTAHRKFIIVLSTKPTHSSCFVAFFLPSASKARAFWLTSKMACCTWLKFQWSYRNVLATGKLLKCRPVLQIQSQSFSASMNNSKNR